MVATVGTVRVGPAPYAEKDGVLKEVPLEKLVTERGPVTNAPEADIQACNRFWKIIMEAGQ